MLLGVIDVNDTENVVTSENLVKLAQDNGFLETDANGNIHVAKTYAKETSAKSSRYWQGLYYVNKQLAANLDWETADMSVNPLDLLVDPDRKLTTLEVLRLLAYRGEGTAYDSNADSYTAIGNNRQTEVHVLETRPNMPTELSTIQWQGMADAEFTVYVPYYTALITETSEFYHTEEKPRDYISGGDTEGQINLNFHLINYLCYNNRANTAEAVKEYFEDYQQSLIDQQKAVDEVMTKVYAHGSEAAKVAATGVGKHLAKQISAMSSAVLAELRVYLASEQTEPFKLSEETLSLMPDYTIDEELLPTHTWTFDRDETTHWHKCEICGETDGKISHSWTTQFDETHHWEECECGATTLEKEHTFVNGECECGAKDANYVNPQPQEPEKDQPKGDSPSTSDSSSLMTYVVMMGFAVLGMVALTKKTKFN